MSIINNRYEFLFYVACQNCNPNGDPDMGNMPRLDPETMQGLITDVSIKRRIRNYIDFAYSGEPGMDIMIRQNINLNRVIAEVKSTVSDDINAKTNDVVFKARNAACSRFFDVRAFGAVMSTGPNAGQVRGAVQFSFGKSLDPVMPMDISITRMAVTEGKDFDTVEKYLEYERKTDSDNLRTMGRKQLIPFGLYEVRGFVSANLAQDVFFEESDLNALFEAILNMYEHDHSASKNAMSVVSPVIIFKHIGTDANEKQRIRQARLGCAPAHKLFDLVNVTKKSDVDVPRSHKDYDAVVNLDNVPAGVEIGFKSNPFDDIVWGELPSDEVWFKRG